MPTLCYCLFRLENFYFVEDSVLSFAQIHVSLCTYIVLPDCQLGLYHFDDINDLMQKYWYLLGG